MNPTITINLAGDVMIGRLVGEHLRRVPPETIWGDMLPYFKKADLNLINLEAALTHSATIVPKVFNFKTLPSHVSALTAASIHVVNLANNHVLDYAEQGLIETLDTLDKAGIKHVGAGRNLKEARQPVIMDVKGVKVGIIGCTDNEPSWAAAETAPGINSMDVDRYGELTKDIHALRPKVDLLILTIHWGPNMRQRPTSSFKHCAHALIDAGVDIFHGHSAHIFQGVEIYNNRVIFYDTGDFVDDYYVDPYLRNDHSFLFQVEADKMGLKGFKLIPTVIENFQVNLSADAETEYFLNRMKGLSAEFETALREENETLSYRFEP